MELQQANVAKTNVLHEEIFVPSLAEKSGKAKEQEKNLKTLKGKQLKDKQDFDRFLESVSDCV
jgi:dynactin complex subunit